MKTKTFPENFSVTHLMLTNILTGAMKITRKFLCYIKEKSTVKQEIPPMKNLLPENSPHSTQETSLSQNYLT